MLIELTLYLINLCEFLPSWGSVRNGWKVIPEKSKEQSGKRHPLLVKSLVLHAPM